MNRLLALTACLGWWLCAPQPASPAATAPARAGAPSDLEFTRHVLPNGLTVLLGEEHTQPLVSVVVWYRVGSRNERPGITGIAHYLEHMAFRATEGIPADQIIARIESLGGHWHGYTRLDNTVYYETARREALDWLLFLEAERMQRALILPAEVEVERGSVLSELKGYENDPWSLLFDDVAAVAFREHPYGYNISGWVSDIEAITHADLVDFYRRHYVPANAILTVVGDFDSSRALASVQRQFGSFPKRPALEPLRTVEPPQRGEKRVKIQMPGTTSHVQIAHPAPAFDHPDFFPFLVLDGLLSGGKGINTIDGNFEIGALGADRRTTRLYRDLVSPGLATRVGIQLLPTLHPYLYTITAEAAPEVTPDALENAMVRTLERLTVESPSREELAAVRERLIRLNRLQSDRYQEAAHLRALLEAYGAGDLWGNIGDGIAAVTAGDIQRVANRYLHAASRTVGRFEPQNEPVPPAAAASPPASAAADSGGASTAAAGTGVKPASRRPGARQTPPEIRLTRIPPPAAPAVRTLPSGLELAAVENHAFPTAALAIDLQAGPFFDPPGREGLAALTSSLLMSGSGGRSAEEVAAAVDRLGLRWDLQVGGTSPDFADPQRIRIEIEFGAADLGEVVSLVAAALRQPAFPADALRTARTAQLGAIAAARDDAEQLAWTRLIEGLYPGSPWGRPSRGSSESAAALKVSAVRDFHTRHYRPSSARLAFAGDWPASEALEILQREFADWEAAGHREATAAGVGIGREAGPESGRGENPVSGPLAPEPARLPHKTQVEMAYGFFPGVNPAAPGFTAFEALWYVVQHGYYSGRLGERIVGQRGLAYSVASHQSLGLPGSPMLLITGAPPEKVEELQRVWVETLQEVAAHGVTAREFEAARTYLDGRRLHGRESNLDAAGAALEWMRDGRDRPQPDPFSLTLEEVNRARVHVKPGQAIWSLAGPVP